MRAQLQETKEEGANGGPCHRSGITCTCTGYTELCVCVLSQGPKAELAMYKYYEKEGIGDKCPRWAREV